MRILDRVPGPLLVFGANLLWGLTATLARHLFRDQDISVFTVVELRLLLSALMLGGVLAIHRPSALVIDRKDWGYFLSLGLLGLAAVQGSYYYAISVLGVGLGILIQYIAPSLIVLYEWMRGTKPSTRTVVALLAATAGIALLVGDKHPLAANARGFDWVVAFSTAFFFAYFILRSKRGLQRYRPETVLFYSSLIAGVAWAVVEPPWKIVAAGHDASVWGLFFVLAVFSTLVPFWLFFAGLERMPASRVGIIATLEPVVAVMSSAFFLGEGLKPLQTVGAGMVLTASVLARNPAPTEEKKPPSRTPRDEGQAHP